MLVEADNALVRGLTSPQRDRGRLTATTAPVSLPTFSFFELPQHGLGEDAEVCPVRGAAVCRPVCATFHRHAEVRHHRSKGQSLGAAPWRRHHGLLVDRGLLHRLCHLYCPAGLGALEVHGLHEEEVPHWEEEVVSFFSWEPGAALTSDLTSWVEYEQARSWFGLHLACEYHELASPATAFVFLPYFFFVFPFLCVCIRRPVALVYVILSTLPCFAFLIASSEVQHAVVCFAICVITSFYLHPDPEL